MSPRDTRTASRTAVALALTAGLGLTTACGTATQEGASGTDQPSGAVASGEPTPQGSGGAPSAATPTSAPDSPASRPDPTTTTRSPDQGRSRQPAPTRTATPTAPSTASREPASTPTNTPTGTPEPAAPLPDDATSYADALVRAWGAGRHAEAARYATPRAVRQLFGHADPGGAHWDQVGTQGAAGTIYVSYRDTVSGDRVTLAVGNIAVGQQQEHAVREVRFG